MVCISACVHEYVHVSAQAYKEQRAMPGTHLSLTLVYCFFRDSHWIWSVGFWLDQVASKPLEVACLRTPALRLQVPITAPDTYMDAKGPKFGPHTCTASICLRSHLPSTPTPSAML